MEQLSLFNAPQLLMGELYKAIDKGNWANIPDIIQSIEKLGIKLPHWWERVNFWQDYGSSFEELENQSPVQIAQFWETLEPVLLEKELQTEKMHLERYWFSRIVKKLNAGQVQYLTHKIHPAFCHLKLGNYQMVVDLVDQHVSNFGENSRLRTYQSFALHKIGQNETALTCLKFALFYDPISIDINYVLDANIQQLFHLLRSEELDEKEIRSVWPLEAWLKKMLEIPDNWVFVRKIQSLYTVDVLKYKPSNTFENQIYFNHLLYITEVKRKNAKLISDDIIRFRTRMNEVNPVAFKRYINRIK